jgi:hypothetical protein
MDKNKVKEALKAKLKQEMSMTGTGASFTPGGDYVATKYAFGKRNNKGTPSDWKPAPSIPNRKSKAMDYEELWEGLDIDDRVKVVYGNEFYGETGTIVDIMRGFAVIEMDKDGKEYSMHMSDVEKIDDEDDDLDESINLKKSKLSSKEYQEAKKLKDFKSEDWKWDAKQDLYVKTVNEAYDKSKIKTNADELARVEDMYKTATTSQMSAQEARIKKLKLLVALEKKYNTQLPVLHYGIDWSDYLKKQDVKTSRELEDKLSSKKENMNEENLGEAYVPENIKKFAQRKGVTSIVNQVARWAEKAGMKIVGGTAIGKNYDTLILDLTYQGGEVAINCENESIEVNGEPVDDYISFLSAAEENETLNENYARFRNETKTRTKPEQFHTAVKQVKQKVNEINRLFEYMNRLQSELRESEGGLKHKKYTDKAIQSIKESTKQLFFKSTKLK